MERDTKICLMQDHWKNIIDSSTAGMHFYRLEKDERLVFLYANQAADDVLGVTHDEFIGKTIEEAFPNLKDTDIPALYKKIASTGQGAKQFEIPYRDRHIKGYYQVDVFNIGPDMIAVSFKDIEKQKIAEDENKKKSEFLESTGQMAKVGGWEMNVETAEISWTKEVYRIYDLPFNKKIVAEEIITYFHPDDAHKIQKAFQRALEHGEPYDLEIRFISAKGRKLWTHTICTPEVIDGKVVRLKGTFQDITDRIHAEQEKNEIQKQLFQSAKLASIGELAAGVGHEINNPLSIIKGNLSLLKEKEETSEHCDAKTIDRIDKIEKASIRIENIVKGLRSLSRSDADKIENVNIIKAINDTISLLSVVFEKDGVIIVKSFKHQALEIVGNTGKVQQVVMNLLSNARDAVLNKPHGVITIEAGEENNTVYFKIIDNGVGIGPDKLERIFDPFYTTKQTGKGTGLGLGISKSIIERMDGTIHTESRPGEGSTLTVSFPKFTLRKDSETSPDIIEYKKLSGSVLIVDDEEDIRELLSICLATFGLEVDEASDGVMALEKIKTKKYDHIITDIKMPRMDGGKLIRELRNKNLYSKNIFIITGAVDLDENYITKLERDLKTDGYIEKPFSRDQIYRLLTKKK